MPLGKFCHPPKVVEHLHNVVICINLIGCCRPERPILERTCKFMRINNTPPIKPTEKTGKKKSSSSSSDVDFTGFLGGADEASETQKSSGAHGVNNFLFMQEVSDEEVKRQKALHQGKTAIQALEQLHRDLLFGQIPEATLLKLEGIVAKKREVFTDPRLSALLDEIELRAAVELAKMRQNKSR
ncbi:MAG: flagellar assembly protein FliX [Alphaproteobacteria bacterium]|nr:flagellar assembly protein FliX [Alphaproteobacteria bacterium]